MLCLSGARAVAAGCRAALDGWCLEWVALVFAFEVDFFAVDFFGLIFEGAAAAGESTLAAVVEASADGGSMNGWIMFHDRNRKAKNATAQVVRLHAPSPCS